MAKRRRTKQQRFEGLVKYLFAEPKIDFSKDADGKYNNPIVRVYWTVYQEAWKHAIDDFMGS